MEPADPIDDPAKVVRAAGIILLLRGTGLAGAGLIAAVKLFPEDDPVRWWTLLPLGVGALLALLSLPAMRALPGTPRRRLLLASIAPVALAWPSVDLWNAWQIRHIPLWLLPLPASFLPDLYALWTLFRGRGRLFVARAMVVLAALSSLVVAWFGAAIFLA